MTPGEIIKEIKSIESTLNGGITDPQAGLIFFLTKNAGFTCFWDDNPIVFVVFGDERVLDLCKADAARFITYFGRKGSLGWETKNISQMSALHTQFMKEMGQDTLF